MRIGVNALYLIPGKVGGSEIYLRNLLPALAEIDSRNDYVVFTNRETAADLPPFPVRVQPVRAEVRPARILWEQTGLVAALRRERIDVLLNGGFTAPLLPPCPMVTVFFDLQHKRHPEYFRWFDLPAWRFLLWAAAHRSRSLIAISEQTRRDLLDVYSLPPSKVHTVPLGVDPRFFDLGPTGGGGYVLCASTLHPHKNLERLIRVFARVRASHPSLKLVLTGVKGFHTEPIFQVIARENLNGAVEVKGWIPREELYGLFQKAEAFVYPSTFEGFGMPVTEALAAGLPTACSNIEPLNSIAAGAALTFPPDDDDAILAALQRLLTDHELRTRLAQAGPARARSFSWPQAARRVLAILEQAT
ncbi:MAG: glycosyltransferase family 1 protein [Bryobacteraceae bacterium]|nr:glycosyltransferase family 1 protein [Bryobacteraceae bacterium]